jgi:hypothetical protein
MSNIPKTNTQLTTTTMVAAGMTHITMPTKDTTAIDNMEITEVISTTMAKMIARIATITTAAIMTKDTINTVKRETTQEVVSITITNKITAITITTAITTMTSRRAETCQLRVRKTPKSDGMLGNGRTREGEITGEGSTRIVMEMEEDGMTEGDGRKMTEAMRSDVVRNGTVSGERG